MINCKLMTSFDDLTMENKKFFLHAIGISALIFVLTVLVAARFF